MQALLNRSIKELRDFKFDSLILTVEEEYKKRNTLQNTINRYQWLTSENDALETLKELQKELANEKKLIQDETNDRNQVIQQLKDTIQEIDALTISEQKYIKKEVKAHENSVKLNCSFKEAQLQQEKELYLKKIEQEKLAHEKIMDFLSSERDDLERSIQEWMVHYEEDSEAKSIELENLKLKRTQDLDKFEELVASYEALEKVVDEDRRIRAQEAEDLRIMKDKNLAASKLQRWYRKQKRIRAQVVILINKMAAKTPAKSGKKGKKKKGKKWITVVLIQFQF